MKTKTMILTAAVACGTLAAIAQSTVYSVNVVGYANVVMPPGFSIIANPLMAPTNTLGVLFAGQPDGFVVYKYDPISQWRLAVYQAPPWDPTNPQWDVPDMTLLPGEGAFVYNPSATPFTNTFVGEVIQGTNLTVNLPGNYTTNVGFQLVGSLIPQEGQLATDLGFPARDGDVIYTYRNSTEQWRLYDYTAPPWDPTNPQWTSGEPTITVGQGFFVYRPTPGQNWVRNFTVPQN